MEKVDKQIGACNMFNGVRSHSGFVPHLCRGVRDNCLWRRSGYGADEAGTMVVKLWNHHAYFVECLLETKQGDHRHPVAVFETMSHAEDWIENCFEYGRRVYRMQSDTPARFAALATPDADELAAEARAARLMDRSPQEATLKLYIARASRLDPFDPQLVVALVSMPDSAGVGVNYRIHRVPLAPPDPDVSFWEREDFREGSAPPPSVKVVDRG